MKRFLMFFSIGFILFSCQSRESKLKIEKEKLEKEYKKLENELKQVEKQLDSLNKSNIELIKNQDTINHK